MSCELADIRAVFLLPKEYEVNGEGEKTAFTGSKPEEPDRWRCIEHGVEFKQWTAVAAHLRDQARPTFKEERGSRLEVLQSLTAVFPWHTIPGGRDSFIVDMEKLIDFIIDREKTAKAYERNRVYEGTRHSINQTYASLLSGVASGLKDFPETSKRISMIAANARADKNDNLLDGVS